jgi:hypothetical protein
VLCGTPLAETDEWDAAAELPPLPPLPDGGLSETMPAWLRAMPGDSEPDEAAALVILATEEETSATPPAVAGPAGENPEVVPVADSREPAPVSVTPAEQSLGPQADPRTFLRDDDFPRWIRELPALPPRPVPQVAVIAPPAPEPTVLVALPEDPAPPLLPHSDPAPLPREAAHQELLPAVEGTEPVPVPAPSPALPAASPGATPREREAWEAPLLLVLLVGIVVAVIWALLINGLIGSGL